MISQGIIHQRESLKLKTNDGLGIQKWLICCLPLGYMGTHLPCARITYGPFSVKYLNTPLYNQYKSSARTRKESKSLQMPGRPSVNSDWPDQLNPESSVWTAAAELVCYDAAPLVLLHQGLLQRTAPFMIARKTRNRFVPARTA